MGSKTQLTGVFTKYPNVIHRVNELFELLGEDCRTVFCYEVIDNNAKQKTMLLTFFTNGYDKLREFKLRPITLHRKENNVILTMNGLNRYLGSDNPEENKKIKLNLDGLQDVLITKSSEPTGYNLSKIVLMKKYDNKNSKPEGAENVVTTVKE